MLYVINTSIFYLVNSLPDFLMHFIRLYLAIENCKYDVKRTKTMYIYHIMTNHLSSNDILLKFRKTCP